MNDYTPTLGAVRESWAANHWGDYEAFDRFLAEHDAALVAEHEHEPSQYLRGAAEATRKALAERDAAREQLRAAETVIEKAKAELGLPLDPLQVIDNHAGRALWLAARGRSAATILSGYPVSSAHTERVLVTHPRDGHPEGITCLDCQRAADPYRVTPTEEPELMADLKLCNQSTPHTFHGWGAGPPWHVCPGIQSPEELAEERHAAYCPCGGYVPDDFPTTTERTPE